MRLEHRRPQQDQSADAAGSESCVQGVPPFWAFQLALALVEIRRPFKALLAVDEKKGAVNKTKRGVRLMMPQ